MRVSGPFRRREAVPDRGDRLVHPSEIFERAGPMEMDVSIVRGGHRRLGVPLERGFVFTVPGVFLGDPVEAEGIAGVGVEHGEEFGESVWLGHVRIVRILAAGGNPGVVAVSAKGSTDAVWMAYARIMIRSSNLVAGLPGICLVLAVLMGCEPSYAPRQVIDLRPRTLEIDNHHGGTRRVSIHHDGQWYQSFGPSIEVIDPEDGLRIARIDHKPWGEIGPISDMIVTEDSEPELVVVHAGDRLVRYQLTNPRRPLLVEEIDAETLGIEPYLLSQEGGRVWASGRGGAVRIDRPGITLLSDEGEGAVVGRVVASGDGLAASVGRRILSVDDGRYLGAASELQSLPSELASEIELPGGVVFILRGNEASTVGIMGGDFRERDNKVFPVPIFAARVLDGRLWAVMPVEIVTWPIENGGRLGAPVFIPIKGARDIAMLRENYYAVGGTFGRAIYRLMADGQGDADTFFAVERTPGRVTMAVGDGRRVLAGSEEGSWLYKIGGSVELSDRALRNNAGQVDEITLSWCDASIEEDGAILRVEPIEGETFEWSPPREGLVYTLEVAGEYLFVGHDDGLECFGYRDGGVIRIGGVWMEGPVAWLFRPRVGDDVAFVSAFGGLGTVKVVADPDSDSTLIREVRRDEAQKVESQMRRDAGMPPIR